MSQQRANLEVIAPSVEEAVAKGLEDLGLPEDAVEVEILDAGSRGLFGLGARQARVRLTIKGAQPEPAQVELEPAAPVVAQMPEEREQPQERAEVRERPQARDRSQEREQPRRRERPQAPVVQPSKPDPDAALRAAKMETDLDQESGEEVDADEALNVASATVRELLGHMKVRAEVSARYSDPDEPNSKPAILVDVEGNDLSILIGPRAETLNALQYIAGLIVSKELGRSVPLVVDVEHFRQRREQQLRQLARRMADQAVKTGKRQVLEPMPANERRLVHIELRGNPDVSTQSIGEDPRRKVTIIPEK